MKQLLKVFKDPISGLTHAVTGVAALAGAVALWWLSPPDLPARLAVLVYGLSLVLMFAASSVYHLVKAPPAWEQWLRKLDHSAIFLFIAGTYTPPCLIVLDGVWRPAMLISVWVLAAAGIAFKLAFIKAPRWVSVSIYLGMGWLGIVGVAQLLEALPVTALLWLLAGGLLYTGGAVIYGIRRPNFLPGVFGFHELWHLFVSAASAAHYVFIAAYVLPLAWHLRIALAG
jgi:hemolysin III